MTTRTDELRPSVIDWSRFALAGMAYLEHRWNQDAAREERYLEGDWFHSKPRESYEWVGSWDDDGQKCACCGSNLRQFVALVDDVKMEAIVIGHSCYETYCESAAAGFNRRLVAAKRESERRFKIQRAEAWLASRGLTEVFAMPHHIIVNMKSRLIEYGELSDKQIEFANRLAIQERERAEAEAAYIAQNGAPEPAPFGDEILITGEILGFKSVESQYGVTNKMIVRDDRGFKVWVTEPSKVKNVTDVLAEGDRISFVASITPSNDDPFFAFGKRPKKAQKL